MEWTVWCGADDEVDKIVGNDDIGKEPCIEIREDVKGGGEKSVERCIYQSIQEVNEQFGKKIGGG